MARALVIEFASGPARRPPRIYPRVPPILGAGPARARRGSPPPPKPPRRRPARPPPVKPPTEESPGPMPPLEPRKDYSETAPSGTLAADRPEIAMPDEQQLRRKVLLRLIGHPAVLVPVVAGCTASTWLWAIQGRVGPGVFALLAGMLLGVGSYFTRALLDQGRTARKVLDEIELQKRAAWDARLDALDRRLVQADQDPRPETALRDLRALLRAFDELARQSGPDHWASVVEIYSGVQQLFEHSVRSLEQTMRLYATAGQLRTPEARQPILEERERIIADIQTGIGKLGSTLITLQRLGVGDQARTDLAQLRAALDDSLQLAQRVEQRLNTLLAHPAPLPETSPAPSETPQTLKGT